MPRRAAAQVRPVEPDPLHRSKLVQQVINKVMLDGKKSTAERIVYEALALIQERGDAEHSNLLAKPLPPVKNGHRELPTDPGLGITIDEDKLRAEVGEPQQYLTRFDPDDGSVNPHAPINSPLASFDTYFFFCASLPATKM